MSFARLPLRMPVRVCALAPAPRHAFLAVRAFGSPTEQQPLPAKSRLEPTTFDGKASPRTVHSRPKPLRGMPQAFTPWEMERAARERAFEAAEAAKAAAEAEAQAAAPSDSKPQASGNGNGQGNGNGNPPKKKPVRMKMEEHSFVGPSRPRAIYTRPSRELPSLKNKIPLYLLLAALGVGAWGLFILYATNNERLSSSVVRQVLFQLRNTSEVADVLGEHVRLAPNWWGFGEPWISGGINLMQGRIDVKFRMRGDKDEGTVYFTSIRPQQSAPWRIVRYKVIADGGETVRLEDKVVRPLTADDAPPAAAA